MATATKTELFDWLTHEQQDHLFYALHEARETVRDYYLLQLGEEVPHLFERVIVEQFQKQLVEESPAQSVTACLHCSS